MANPTIDTMNIVVSASTSQAQRSLDKLTNSLNKSEKSTRNATISLNRLNISGGKSRSVFTSLASTFGKLYASCFLVIRGIKGIGKAIQSAMDYVETYNYFSVTMSKINSDFGDFGEKGAENYVNSFQQSLNELTKKMTGYDVGESGELIFSGDKNLGLDPQVVMNFQAKVSAITNAVGQVGQVSVDTSKALTMLSADLSSLTNVDIETVMGNLQSGLIGQSRALYKYGIDITNATLEQYALANGITKSVSEMTQAEKMQLRLLAILDQSKVAWGDQANTLSSVANQYRIMKQQVSNLARILGNLFLPIVMKVLPVVNGLLIAISSLFETLGFSFYGENWLTDIMGGISSGYVGDLSDDMEDLADSEDNAAGAAKKLKNSLLGIDELNVLNQQDSSGSGGVSAGGVDLSGAISDALGDYESVWEQAFAGAENKAQKFAQIFKDAFADIPTFLNNAIKPESFKKVGESLANALNDAIYWALDFGKRFDWANLGLSIAEGINGFFETFDFSSLGATISAWAKGILTLLTEAVKNVKWADVGKAIGEFFSSIDWAGITFDLLDLANAIQEGLIEAIANWADTDPFSATIVGCLAVAKLTGASKAISTALTTALSTQALNVSLGTVIFSSIASAVIGFDLGKVIGEAITGDKETYQNFHWFGEDGFFPSITDDFGITWDAFVTMLNDYKNEPAITTLANAVAGPFLSGAATISLAGSKIKETLENLVKNLKTYAGKAGEIGASVELVWKNVWANIKAGFNGMIAGIKAIWNQFATWLNEKLTWEIKPITIAGNQIFDGATINLGKIPTFAEGGFPEDGWFRASQGEMIGRFDNGQSVVANNQQITEGIAYGVERAVTSALVPYLRDIATNTQETANKDFSVNIGDRDIARANQRGQRSMGLTLRTT